MYLASSDPTGKHKHGSEQHVGCMSRLKRRNMQYGPVRMDLCEEYLHKMGGGW